VARSALKLVKMTLGKDRLLWALFAGGADLAPALTLRLVEKVPPTSGKELPEAPAEALPGSARAAGYRLEQ
jgi:hypothetical protein